MSKSFEDFKKGYEIGVHYGMEKAKFQKSNINTDLPSNDTLYKIFDLLFECKENDRKTSGCYINSYEHYASYITRHWND